MKLDYLKDKSFSELILEFPNLDWSLRRGGLLTRKVKLDTITFVYYEIKKPRKEVDLYRPISVSDLTKDGLSFIEKEKERGIGLISKVKLGYPFEDSERKYAHIPMIDFDTDEAFGFMKEDELVEVIKQKTVEATELDTGVILRSGPKRNYHFVGVGSLLSEDDLITFIGLALSMRYKTEDGRKLHMVDSWMMGSHGLAPMKYIPEVEKTVEPNARWSRYGFKERFLTLRANRKPAYADYPRVVEVF